MIPIKLTMQSFGPYKGSEVIDFTKFYEDRLFLITGNTGSGKTMIFDAICYALFGESSGQDRKVDTLQSQFSDKTLITYVEFEFYHRGKKYLVNREPDQRKISRGKEVNHKPTSKLIFDDEVYTGVKTVNSKVKEILGLDYSQFKQIVMIAQGEFRKLVSADSRERETIYRRIFNTNNFEKIQNILKERYLKLENEVGGLNEKIKGFLSSIEPIKEISYEELPINEILNILSEEINKYDSKIVDLKTSKESCMKNIEEENILLSKVDELIALQNKFNEFDIPKLKVENEYLKKVSNTFLIIEKEDVLNNLNRDHEKIKDEKDKLSKELSEKQQEFNVYKVELENSESTKDKINDLSNQIFEIEKLESTIEDKIKFENENKIYFGDLNKFNKSKELILNTISKFENDREVKLKFTVEHKDVNNKILNIKESLNNLNLIENNLIKYNEGLDDFKKNKIEYEKIIPKYNEIFEEYTEKNKELLEKEEIYLRNQAGILANKLTEDTPCMVCGSKIHPNKAKLLNEEVSQEHIKKLKEEVGKLEQERNTINETANEYKIKCENSENNLKDKYNDLINCDSNEEFIKFNIFEIDNKLLDKIKSNLNELLKQLENNNNIVEMITKYSDLIITIDENIRKEKSELENLNTKIGELEKHIHANQLILEEKNNDLTKYNIKTKDNYIEVLNKVKKEYNSMVEKQRSLDENIKKCNESILKINTQINVKNEDISNMISKIDISKKTLKESIESNGFSDYEEYKKFKLSREEYELREKNIEEKRNEYNTLKTNISNLIKELKDKGINSKEEIVNKLKETREKLNEVENDEKGYLNNISLLKSAEKNISLINKEIGEKDNYKNSLNELNKISNGNNKYKISFERYILGIYFKEIIASANIRFSKLTNGRYLFRHLKDKFDMRIQQGLDISVFDNHTSSERKINTLSGGESFKASLSLALGLSDVVQRYSGGISIDTLFIDEGFGSLDSDSIQKALECLIEANDKSKLIGIISHVQELKEFIKSKIEVKDSKEGSEIQLFY